MTWHVDRRGKLHTHIVSVTFRHKPEADKLSAQLKAMEVQTHALAMAAPHAAAQTRIRIERAALVTQVMEDAELGKDAPAMEAYADQLMKGMM